MKFKYKALLLEDDALCRTVMAEILRDHDFEVMAFSDPTGYDACRLVPECQKALPCVDVIVTDNEMPHMTGLEFLEKTKRMKCKVPDTHKALISGSLSTKDLEKAGRLGCRFFHKPSELSEFSSWLAGKADQQRNGSEG